MLLGKQNIPSRTRLGRITKLLTGSRIVPVPLCMSKKLPVPMHTQLLMLEVMRRHTIHIHQPRFSGHAYHTKLTTTCELRAMCVRSCLGEFFMTTRNTLLKSLLSKKNGRQHWGNLFLGVCQCLGQSYVVCFGVMFNKAYTGKASSQYIFVGVKIKSFKKYIQRLG